MERREALTLVGTVASVTVAGCSSELPGDESDDDNGSESDDGDANAETDGDDRTTSENPERAVEGYYQAVSQRDATTANEFVTNEDSNAYIEREFDADSAEISFRRLEEISVRAWLEGIGEVDDDLDLDEQVRIMRLSLEDHMEEAGYDEYAFVHAEIVDSEDETDVTVYALLFERDGEWLIDDLEEITE